MANVLLMLSSLLLCFGSSRLQPSVSFSEEKFYHKAVLVDSSHVKSISDVSANLSAFWNVFDNIAIVRVPGTAGHAIVQKFIKGEMTRLGWTIEEDKFMAPTVVGEMPFNNIIATHNPQARRFLDLACHYDSKHFQEFKFIAATDSAAPCAIMIQLAHNLRERLNAKKNSDLSLRFIFFDGEEAFVEWSNYDSLYGARHLAEKWAKEPYPEGGGDSTQLDRIDMLVLLDLLGAKNPRFYNHFANTQNWYKMLVGAEEKLTRGNHLFSQNSPFFKKMSTNSHVEDDHIPFLRRHVPVLHIIPTPFPKVWHRESDNRDAIDEPTVMDLVKVISTFVYEYMHLHT